MRRPFCVGLTGGIAVGKTTVACLFAGLGAGVIDTDVISHSLTGVKGTAMPAIIKAFGPAVAGANGALDRKIMRDIAFADVGARTQLEAILHPMILDEAESQLDNSESTYVILIVPLLVENLDQYRALTDRILVVDCDEELQVARAVSRPGMDEELVRSILAIQSSRTERLTIADNVISNVGNKASLESRIKDLHAAYQQMSASR